MILFDLETDGLLDTVTKLHCAVTYDVETDEWREFNDQDDGTPSIQDFLDYLEYRDACAHYGCGYDFRVLELLFPEWKHRGMQLDSVLMTKILFPNLKERDWQRVRKARTADFPMKLIGSHSLKAWGIRLGILKGDFGETTDWSDWSPEMQEYCVQDVVVLKAIWEMCVRNNIAWRAVDLENGFARIIQRQEAFGFCFDIEKAEHLEGRLMARKAELNDELQQLFPPWEVVTDPCFIPRVNNKTRGYVKGVPVVKKKMVTFNPGSRDHIADRLQALFGWQPLSFGDNGKPNVDEKILKALPYPPIPQLAEYLMIAKRLGQLATGKQAWLKLVRNGRIHGRVDTVGAVSARCTHKQPNVAQTPACGAPYGEDCRELFTVPPKWLLVGADAAGLELRCLGHFLARYDDGAYIDLVLNGDAHSANACAMFGYDYESFVACRKDKGLLKDCVDDHKHARRYFELVLTPDERETKTVGNFYDWVRAQGKTCVYAWLYGSGEENLGDTAAIVLGGGGAPLGKRIKKNLMEGIPALKKLSDAVQQKVKRTKSLTGLDGRILHSRSAHSALNLLLQSAGALIMKQALIELDNMLHERVLVPGEDYEFSANVHDEFQCACNGQIVADTVAELAPIAMRRAGEFFNFRIPIDGESKIGKTWKETH